MRIQYMRSISILLLFQGIVVLAQHNYKPDNGEMLVFFPVFAEKHAHISPLSGMLSDNSKEMQAMNRGPDPNAFAANGVLDDQGLRPQLIDTEKTGFKAELVPEKKQESASRSKRRSWSKYRFMSENKNYLAFNREDKRIEMAPEKEGPDQEWYLIYDKDSTVLHIQSAAEPPSEAGPDDKYDCIEVVEMHGNEDQPEQRAYGKKPVIANYLKLGPCEMSESRQMFSIISSKAMSRQDYGASKVVEESSTTYTDYNGSPAAGAYVRQEHTALPAPVQPARPVAQASPPTYASQNERQISVVSAAPVRPQQLQYNTGPQLNSRRVQEVPLIRDTQREVYSPVPSQIQPSAPPQVGFSGPQLGPQLSPLQPGPIQSGSQLGHHPGSASNSFFSSVTQPGASTFAAEMQKAYLGPPPPPSLVSSPAPGDTDLRWEMEKVKVFMNVLTRIIEELIKKMGYPEPSKEELETIIQREVQQPALGTSGSFESASLPVLSSPNPVRSAPTGTLQSSVPGPQMAPGFLQPQIQPVYAPAASGGSSMVQGPVYQASGIRETRSIAQQAPVFATTTYVPKQPVYASSYNRAPATETRKVFRKEYVQQPYEQPYSQNQRVLPSQSYLQTRQMLQ